MELGRRKIGELVGLVGVVLGFIAIWMHYYEGASDKYADDGTLMAVLIVTLGIAACCLATSLLLDKPELDLTAAVAGAVAFGFFLMAPAVLAFDHLDKLGSGSWLGICAGLIPLGAGAAQLWHRQSDAKAPGVTLWTAAAAAGLVLIVIGIWSKIASDTPTYWNVSVTKNSPSGGHAVGLLMLLLAIASALLIAVAVNTRKAELADLAQIVSGITVGVASFEGVGDAFNQFSVMRSGAWLELIGGLVLLLALIGSRVVKLPELIKK